MTQLPYPLIARGSFAWWKPIVGVLALFVAVYAFMPTLLSPIVALALLLQGDAVTGDGIQHAAAGKPFSPASLLFMNLLLASLIPLTWGIYRGLHGRLPRWLASVKPGIRWKFLAACAGAAAIAISAQLAVGSFLPGVDPVPGTAPDHATGTLAAFGLIILLTTPLQAIGEEYAFRGYLNQAFGPFFADIADRLGVASESARRIGVWAAIVLCSGLFAVAHGLQNFPLFFDRFAFGMLAGFLVLRTGGLEAGIALHVFNNLAALGLALGFGDIHESLRVHEVSYWQLVLTATQDLVFLALVLWLAKRFSVQRTTNANSIAPIGG